MIYAIRFGHHHYYKFGVSENPEARLADLQVGAPLELKLVVTADWPSSLEACIHQYLRETRLLGEWFYESPRLLAILQCMDDQENGQRRFLDILYQPHIEQVRQQERELARHEKRRTRRLERMAWWRGVADHQSLRARFDFVLDQTGKWVRASSHSGVGTP